MASIVPAVCLALTALWQPLTEVQVANGPQANSDASDHWLFVAYDGDAPEDGKEAVEATQELMAFARTKGEDAEVTCAVISRRGDADIPAAQARAYEILADAEDLLRADMQLGGLVMHAFVSAHRYIPALAPSAKVRVVFTVTYKAQL